METINKIAMCVMLLVAVAQLGVCWWSDHQRGKEFEWRME